MRPARPGRRSFGSQLVLLVAAVTAVVVLLLTILVQVVLARSTTRSLDTVLRDRAQVVVGSVSTDRDGRVVVPDARLDAGVAVYDSTGRLAAGSVPTSQAATYADLSTVTARTYVDRPGSDESRVLAQPFDTGAGGSGVVVVTERLAPYERAERQALLVCVGAGLLMVALAAGLAAWVSHRALAPVAAMTAAADDWSEHDLTHRFDLGPDRNEIAALGRTLDRLLERVATAIRSEQRLTSELAHELRTPLAAIQANADLALLHRDLGTDVQECLEEIAVSTRRMGTTIESLLELARSESTQALGASCLLRDAVDDALSAIGADGVSVTIDPATRVLLPHALAVRAMSPVLENAHRLAGRVVVTVAASRPGFVDLLVDDDGPGIAPGDREAVFEPGHTQDHRHGAGAGLGLALSRRVARSMGGDVRVVDGPLATRVSVTLPTP
ncbi:HAMP domain-containing sensor histidine kinase [Nocardioides rubriscoriae]|uniref:HAMP domain-containing sensor histidine kinase n=1 Tax=Nocardioides rubriscoriae TaxID=642762 RepID=UPI0011DFC497|nr:HAMP domain-containing sensor histidine kinase [Nocardioides rubriscoriae]